MNTQKKKVDKRAYTFMLVPHRGDKTYSYSLPIKTVKKLGAVLATVCFVFAAFQVYNIYIVNKAQSEQAELIELRENKEAQEEKVRKLAQITESLQEEMLKVNQLENDVRRSLGTDETTVSRSGVNRELPGNAVTRLRTMDNLSVEDITERTMQLTGAAKDKQAVLSTLNNRVVERNNIRAATPSIWPASGDVTSRFGPRRSPNGMGSSFHKGIDIASSYGTPIYATARGRVEVASWYYGYGLYILIDHGYGIKTAYGHNSSLAVSVGQSVEKGQVIAYMGNTGVSTGIHVHYEVIKNGTQIDPANFL